MGKQLYFGIDTPQQHVTYEKLLEIWLEADSESLIEHMWLFDHFMPLGNDPGGPCFESWTLLAGLATQTKRVRLGHLVTGNTYRHPAILAKQAVTVDHLSHGRLNFGIGAAWHEQEHQGYGLPFPNAAERVKRLDEACQIIQQLWTVTTPTFHGHYYQLQQAPSEPKPYQRPCPPIIIAAAGDHMLRVVAKYANVWSAMSRTVEDFREKSARLIQYCEAIGRDPATLERLVMTPVNLTDPDLYQAREAAQSFIQAGATHIVFNTSASYPKGVVRRLVDEVIKPLKESEERSLLC